MTHLILFEKDIKDLDILKSLMDDFENSRSNN